MHPTRRGFLVSGLAALGGASFGRPAWAEVGAPEFMVVMIANGGWDVTFCMDPKNHTPEVEGPEFTRNPANPNDVEEVRNFGDIPVFCNDLKRRSVSTFFERHGSRTAVVNGIWTGSIVHQPCRIRMFTGSTAATQPDLATIVGAQWADRLPLGSIDFSGLGYTGPLASTTGRVGHRSQLKALLDPMVSFRAPSYADYTLPLFDPPSDAAAAMSSHLERRAEALRTRLGGGVAVERQVDALLDSLARRHALLESGQVITSPLQLGVEPELGLQANLAASLLSSGLCRTVTMAHASGWDTHDFNAQQHNQFEEFFAALNLLMGELETRNLLSRTLVVCLSEMTRTPKHNSKGGKDHWPHTSALMIGAGVRGGMVFGGTNDAVESLPVDLASGVVSSAGELNKYSNFAAGVVERMGVDPAEFYPTIRPFSAPFG